MRGHYGRTHTPTVIVGATIEPGSFQSDAWQNAKVGAVITLAAIAAVTAGKVLSTKANRRRSY